MCLEESISGNLHHSLYKDRMHARVHAFVDLCSTPLFGNVLSHMTIQSNFILAIKPLPSFWVLSDIWHIWMSLNKCQCNHCLTVCREGCIINHQFEMGLFLSKMLKWMLNEVRLIGFECFSAKGIHFAKNCGHVKNLNSAKRRTTGYMPILSLAPCMSVWGRVLVWRQLLRSVTPLWTQSHFLPRSSSNSPSCLSQPECGLLEPWRDKHRHSVDPTHSPKTWTWIFFIYWITFCLPVFWTIMVWAQGLKPRQTFFCFVLHYTY